jgi:hypothetical protein
MSNITIETAHPFPWHVADCDGQQNENPLANRYVYDAEDSLVVECDNPVIAKFIAAGPSVLEAAQYMVQGRPGELQYDNLWGERAKAVRQAIASATER